MPITMDWGNDAKNISHMKFTKNWNWSDFYIAIKKGFEMTDSVDHKVHVILDFSESNGSLPPSAITHFKKAATKAHPRRGIVVLVSKRMLLIKSIVKVIQKIARVATPLLFADSVEEAYSIINHILDEKPDTIHLR